MMALCSDGDLRALAVERQRAFDEAISRLSPAEQKALLSDQDGWQKTYTAACGLAPDVPPSLPLTQAMKDCMVQAGRARIEYLRAYAVEPSGHGTISSPIGNASKPVSEPKFSDFPAVPYHGPQTSADLSTKEARAYRTRLSNAARQAPNFAGHYVVTEWGCGTGCLTGAILDVKTGKAVFLPVLLGSGSTGHPVDDQNQKFEYRVDSYLLRVIGSLGTDAPYHFTENFFVLKAGELGALTGTSVAAGASPTSAPPAGAVSPTPLSDGTSQASPQSGEVAPIGAFLAVVVVLGILVAVGRAHERAKMRRREIQFICEYFNLINASRRFPTVDVPIVLEEREFGLLATPATLCEMRAHRATAGGRVRIAKGVRVGVRRYEYSYRQLDPIASGILVVTNRRVVFKSDERPVHFGLSELLDVEYAGYLRLLIRRRQTPIILSIAHGNLAMWLIRVFAKGLFLDGRLPEGLVMSARPSARGRGVDLSYDMPGAATTPTMAASRP
jgi:hypothetical protein